MSGVHHPSFPYHFGTFLNRTLENPRSGELLQAPDLPERRQVPTQTSTPEPDPTEVERV